MKKHDSYAFGPHSYWLHFVAGFVFGGILGCWLLLGLFGSTVIDLFAVVLTAFAFAAFCGRWGEYAWDRISDWLRRWFWPR